ncbi:MAG: LytR/AlgR family response regulator transcription factor [Chthoniobacterales bacterium]
MLRVMLVDDERLARQSLRQSLARIEGVELVAEAENVAMAREAYAEKRPDAVFLDIQMPREDGFEFLRDLDGAPKVVFVTAYSEHAVRAFEVEAVDYLLKPVRPKRLADAVSRLREACGLNEFGEQQYAKTDRICLRTPGRTVVATLDKVLMLEADGDFTRFFVAGEPSLMICQKLGAYERMLPAPPFVRVSRSLMLNVDAFARSQRLSRDEEQVWLTGLPEPIALGRAAQQRLREALGG